MLLDAVVGNLFQAMEPSQQMEAMVTVLDSNFVQPSSIQGLRWVSWQDTKCHQNVFVYLHIVLALR